MRAILSIFVLSIFLYSCGSYQPPQARYEQKKQAKGPDYAQLATWCAHPQKEDYADKTPQGIQGQAQETAEADVFFVHPTTYMKGNQWNADIENTELNEQTDRRAIMHQASIFNRACKVYAPRYRQMVYGGFLTPDTTSKRKALDLAYQDVKSAFEYYLKHHNAGRPIVIAGHSQGARHALRLLKEYFDNTELQQQLVAAYIPGWPFKVESFEKIPVCNAPNQTGCVMGWNTWKKKAIPESIDGYYKDAVVVNPINWQADESYASESLHKGFLNGKYKKVKPQAIDAQKYKGILWVKSPLPLAPIKNFHVGDFNLFWLDVRENVSLRVDNFLDKP